MNPPAVRWRLRALRSYRPRHCPAPIAPTSALPEIPRQETLAALHEGVYVPEYGLRIPWGIARDALFRLIPREAFNLQWRCWPRLRFTLCGVTAVYAFNFVSRGGRLCELQYYGTTPRRRSLMRTQRLQRACLGLPNKVDGFNQYTWGDRQVWLCNSIHTCWRPPDPRSQQVHALTLWRRDD